MAKRQIILDTETTGLSPAKGHRIIEIGCIEMIDRRLTDKHFHYYLNPHREVDPGAVKVHGLTREFLSDKPDFNDIVEDFLRFVKGAELIIHNAPFDIGFLDHELKLLGASYGTMAHHTTVFDTLPFARKRHPGQRNTLDALCSRYQVDNTNRELHGALLDSEILARVYLAMTSEQFKLFGSEGSTQTQATTGPTIKRVDSNRPAIKIIRPNAEEAAAHQAYLEGLEG